ncbi:MAG: sulfurtransferase TusA family protein [Deltaproteobacteria bacterium]|nr:MAG: sulfurtransferase TusA family protein [Deltaproteobacteria bacterium]
MGSLLVREIKIEERKIEVASTLDAVGLFCPMPIAHLQLELEGLNSNQVLEVLADDSGLGEDVINWCKETKNKLLSLAHNEEDIFVAYVEKT